MPPGDKNADFKRYVAEMPTYCPHIVTGGSAVCRLDPYTGVAFVLDYVGEFERLGYRRVCDWI
jgi:hypothetical protein